MRRIIATVSEVHNEAVDVLEKLNQLELKTCSDAHNLMMQKSSYLRQILSKISVILRATHYFVQRAKGD